MSSIRADSPLTSCPQKTASRETQLTVLRELERLVFLFFLLLVLFLDVFLVLIALFAGLALFVSSDAALVRAFFAVGLGLLTAGLFLVGFSAHDRTGQDRECAHGRAEDLDDFHIFVFED